MKQITALILAGFLAACAPSGELQSEDPYESFNRNIFAFNEVVDTLVLKPVSEAYRAVVPQRGRNSIRNVFRNFYEPVTMANSLLQGDADRMFTSFWRFMINSTLGVGGLYDFAGENTDLKYRDEDFGQTLAVWSGDSDSPYLVLPILGPSTTRDAFGRVVDVGLDPWNYGLKTWESVAIAAGDGIVQRERLLDPIDDIYETSLDPYATIRSAYLQQRRAEIANTHNPNTALATDDK